MHPVIRVAGLIALAVGLASAAPAALGAATALIGMLAANGGQYRRVFLDPVRRLKWLLLSILALYAFMLPGAPLLTAWPSYSPSLPGLVEGLLRCWMLLLMAGSARLLMGSTPREDIMGALYWFTRPLAWLGLDSARFCMRLVLTMEYALAFRRPGVSVSIKEEGGGFAERAAALARGRLRDARRAAAEAPTGPVVIPRCGAPPVWQWGAPLGLLVALLALAKWVRLT